jgi:hypothetical protein
MADITEQATQDELADSLMYDPEPQPQEKKPEDAEPEQLEAEPPEQEPEEEADDWLPTEQEKVFPDDVLAKYAKRYGVDEKWLENPSNKQLLHDKINSDIYLRLLRQQQEAEPEEEPEAEPEPEPTQPQPQITFEQHVQNIQSIVKQRTSPEMAQWMFNGFMTAFGVDKPEIARLAPTQAQAFTEVLSVGALNLIQTFAPDLFQAFMPQVMEQQYPEFGGMYQRSATAQSWDSIRNELENPELPAYGTHEFAAAARKIGAEIAGSDVRFDRMVFNDAKGKPLSDRENRAEKLRMIAERMVNGGGQAPQIPPALMAQAVQTGQKAAARKQAQQQAGNLGNGKSRTQSVSADKDDIFAEGIELYNREHGRL